MNHSVVVVAVGIVMAIGVAGTVVPALPGLALVWTAGLAYGLIEGIDVVGAVSLIVMAVLALAGAVVGYAIPRRAAAATGAAQSSMWLGVIGALIGFFVVPIIGLPFGGALGLYIGESLRTGDRAQAARTTRATLIAFGLAGLAQIAVGLLMIATWLVWVLVG